MKKKRKTYQDMSSKIIKRRSPQDSTLRNVRAANKKFAALARDIDNLYKRLAAQEALLHPLSQRIAKLEDHLRLELGIAPFKKLEAGK